MMDAIWLIFLMFLAFMATEGTIEYFLGTLFDMIEKLKPHKWMLMYGSAFLGIGLAFYYKVDMVFILAQSLAIPDIPITPVGILLTGIALGRGANFVNDVWQRFFPTAGARSADNQPVG